MDENTGQFKQADIEAKKKETKTQRNDRIGGFSDTSERKKNEMQASSSQIEREIEAYVPASTYPFPSKASFLLISASSFKLFLVKAPHMHLQRRKPYAKM
jgi:hypothetical protein